MFIITLFLYAFCLVKKIIAPLFMIFALLIFYFFLSKNDRSMDSFIFIFSLVDISHI